MMFNQFNLVYQLKSINFQSSVSIPIFYKSEKKILQNTQGTFSEWSLFFLFEKKKLQIFSRTSITKGFFN